MLIFLKHFDRIFPLAVVIRFRPAALEGLPVVIGGGERASAPGAAGQPHLAAGRLDQHAHWLDEGERQIKEVVKVNDLIELGKIFQRRCELQNCELVTVGPTVMSSGHRVAFFGPILMFPMCEPGLNWGPPHMVQGVG